MSKTKLYSISLPDGSDEYIYISDSRDEVIEQMEENETIDSIYDLVLDQGGMLAENRRIYV